MNPATKRTSSGRDPTATFFEELASRGHVPLLHHESGTIRVDLQDGSHVEHWYITLDRGTVAVSHRNARADAVMRTERKLFDGMAKGTVNTIAALLRGVLDVEGDLGLLSSLARLFPGPPRSRVTFLERQKERTG